LINEKQFPNNTIFISLYCDEAEMANPLGSKSGKHKLMNFYYSILDMPSHFQSSMLNLPLLISVKGEDFKSSSSNSILKFIVDELKELWDKGISFKIDEKVNHVKVCLSQICGDNLGLHALLGFSEGFTANFPCRRCKMHRKDCQTSFQNDTNKLRNRANYEEDCNKNSLSLTGINFKSVLNELPYLHVTENFVFDIMHDVLEGVGPDLLLHVINHCIKQKYFTVNNINYRLDSFNFGRHFKTSKPSQIKASHLKGDNKIGQSASQMLCFLLHFPLLVADSVPDDDENWNLYLLFVEIVTILLSNSITKGGIVYLNSLIEEYCSRYQQNFKKTLKPKHHHLLHYAEAMQKIGPLRQFWSMSFEAKHKFFKTSAHSICNFKNISKSLSYRHQLARAFHLLSVDIFTPCMFEIINYDYVKVNSLPHPTKVAEFFSLEDDSKIKVSDLVVHNGCEYKTGCFVLISFCSKFPVFGKVVSIILENDDCNLCIEEVSGCFNEKFACYSLESTNVVKIIDINTIQFYLPLYSTTSFQLNCREEYIVLPVKYV
jgi:hypothetical protein